MHQSFVPGRSCSIYDWIADTAGAVSGALTFIAFLRIVQNRIKNKY
ncbi:VanZ family protein [Treponema sp.]